MSGIFGIIGVNQRSIEPEWIAQMATHLRHRAPDGMNTWVENSIGMGQGLMIITPESRFESQPLFYGDWVIVADARIDNRADLLKKFNLPASIWKQTPDSVLIAKAFEKWGRECPIHLIGDFVFVIWDKNKQELFAATDHAGVRPLVYVQTPHYFVFSTEEQALLKLDFVPVRLNEQKMKHFLLNYWIENGREDTTFIEGVRTIMPATTLQWSQKTNVLIKKEYWVAQHTNPIHFSNKSDYLEQFKGLVEQAIYDRIRTDYNVGISLSGGLDSSTIACIAAPKLASQNRLLYSASSVLADNHTGQEQDERFYIDEVLKKHSNIVPNWVTSEGIQLYSDLQDEVEKLCSPPNPYYFLDKSIQVALKVSGNTRVNLSGYVGDGTVSFNATDAIYHLAKCGRPLAAVKQAHLRATNYQVAMWKVIGHDLLLPFLPLAVQRIVKPNKYTFTAASNALNELAVNRSMFTAREQKQLARQLANQYNPLKNFYDYIWTNHNGWFVGGTTNIGDAYFGQQEVYPFADRRIIEYLYSIPIEIIQYDGISRGILRRAMEGILPPTVQWRHNKGAYSPDYQTLLMNQKKRLLEELEQTRNNALVTKWIDIDKVMDKLRAQQPAGDWSWFDNASVTQVHFGFMAQFFLQWLSKIEKPVT